MVLEVCHKIPVEIEEREVLRLQGYQKGEMPKGEVKEILSREIEEGYRLIQPGAIHIQVAVKKMGDGIVELANGLTLKVGKGWKEWEGAEYLAAALCTIGSALEERVGELFSQQEFAAASILDSVGSVAVENVADQLNHFLCQQASNNGLNPGPRLSPGYGNWNLTDQKVLFKLVPGERIGIKLNEQCMMLPLKSISFCLGMGKTMRYQNGINPCRHCGMKICQYRRGGS